jgi:pectin methylesterase-like acyl-CoA thioesterase
MNHPKYKQIVSLLAIAGLLLWLNGGPPTAYAAPGDIYCVIPSGGTYLACDQVFTTIQAAVDAATGGEEIRVAAGTYTDVQARSVSDDYPS